MRSRKPCFRNEHHRLAAELTIPCNRSSICDGVAELTHMRGGRQTSGRQGDPEGIRPSVRGEMVFVSRAERRPSAVCQLSEQAWCHCLRMFRLACGR